MHCCKRHTTACQKKVHQLVPHQAYGQATRKQTLTLRQAHGSLTATHLHSWLPDLSPCLMVQTFAGDLGVAGAHTDGGDSGVLAPGTDLYDCTHKGHTPSGAERCDAPEPQRMMPSKPCTRLVACNYQLQALWHTTTCHTGTPACPPPGLRICEGYTKRTEPGNHSAPPALTSTTR